MPFVSVNGMTMHYQHHLPENTTANRTPPVVLLSGMASDSNSWQPVINQLRKHHELIIPDNRCTGRTEPSPVSTSRAAMLTDTQALLRALQIEKYSILGHSMGGMLGWALAAAAPERAHRLISASALPVVLPARISLFESLAALRNEHTEAQWFELLYHFLFRQEFFNDPDNVEITVAASQAYPYKQSAIAFAHQVKALRSFASMPDIDAITCPVTVLTGRHDVLMTPLMLNDFVQDKPHIRSAIIDAAAHSLHWEQTDEFVKQVLEALQ